MSKKPGKGHNATGGIAAERLRSFIERIERLEEEKRAIGEDIREIYNEAKTTGFDTKTMRTMVRLRKLSASQIEEERALEEIYMAALGMLADTPLGAAALKKLTGKKPPGDDEGEDTAAGGEAETSAVEEVPGDDVDAVAAKAIGAEAARAGRPILSNPFPALDPRRAAFDEGWCQAAGSDGMDLPEAWQRSKKPKPAKGEGAEGGDDGAE